MDRQASSGFSISAESGGERDRMPDDATADLSVTHGWDAQARRGRERQPQLARSVKQRSASVIRALDLFCGVGGSSDGARRAGVRIVAAVDVWELATTTYRDNFKGVKLYPGRCERLPAPLPKRLSASTRTNSASSGPACGRHSSQ